MGKVQRGRKKDYKTSRRATPKPDEKPEQAIGENAVTEQDEIEEACKLSFLRMTYQENETFFDKSEDSTHAFVSGEPLFFNDVPERFSLKDVPLYSRKYMSFAKCDVCTSYTAKATISECGHRFCDNCARVSRSRKGVFCQYCRKQFEYNVLKVAEDFLTRLILSCRCGFEGTLLEIRIHLSTKGGKCHEHRLPLLPLLQPKEYHTINDEWVLRSKFLDVTAYRDRESFVPPGSFDPVFEKAQKDPALPHVYLDFDSDGWFLGRLYIELHADIVPKTVARFLDLLKDPKGYKGSEIEFMVPDTFFQVKPLSGYGRATRGLFEDESFKLKHDKPGALAMTNFGPNSNQNGFYVTNVEMPWRDGSNVVFGYVIANHHIIKRICELAREDGSVARRLKIIGCGMVNDWILPSVFSGFELFDST